METMLLLITLLSVAAAGLMSIVLLRVLREERRRTEARVALLQELAFAREDPPAAPPAVRVHRQERREAVATAPVARTWAPAHPLDETPEIDLPLKDVADDRGGLAPPDLFARSDATSPWRQRLWVASAAALVVLALGGVWYRAAPADVTRSDAVAAAPALELLSLEHSYADGTLTIKGVVLNPGGAPARRDVHATGMALDPDGAPLASARAALDFRMLPAGAESPFVVRIPVGRSPARYRVGFRTPGDEVVPHVDKRDAAPVARKEVP